MKLREDEEYSRKAIYKEYKAILLYTKQKKKAILTLVNLRLNIEEKYDPHCVRSEYAYINKVVTSERAKERKEEKDIERLRKL